MARRNKHDAQVDPFTAGEPTLPWDESPSPFGENDQAVEECAFGDEPYDGPTKEPDNYNAPAADEEQEPVTSIDPMYLRALFFTEQERRAGRGQQEDGPQAASDACQQGRRTLCKRRRLSSRWRFGLLNFP